LVNNSIISLACSSVILPSKQNELNILFIFVVTVSIAYIFGIVLVRTMDERLSKIKIEPSQEFFEKAIGASEYSADGTTTTPTGTVPSGTEYE
jgi:hypothetical protein